MGMRAVETGMRTLDEIHERIERLSEERTELWHRLSDQHDPEVRARLHELRNAISSAWPPCLSATLRQERTELSSIRL